MHFLVQSSLRSKDAENSTPEELRSPWFIFLVVAVVTLAGLATSAALVTWMLRREAAKMMAARTAAIGGGVGNEAGHIVHPVFTASHKVHPLPNSESNMI
ncbi:hypothetical protein CYMTET_6539 [Cymbomonas tetramitiformis]|uniref:Uncharacterized protein n=1 Tax=Cymbomonas tetramitiformis TaxID=36881 RepID=A0AAE0GWW7_9CHLO|nr:hypothetical protein CYMTET_6539 [Cymbomonas tetramitiformis]